MQHKPAFNRFMRFVQFTGGGCWYWTGGVFQRLGYGRFNAFALWRLITAIDAEDTPVTRRRSRP
jgi:hypothetical protein